jgi:hypothetical protein
MNRFKSLLPYGVLFILILPFLLLSIYAQPSYDDFSIFVAYKEHEGFFNFLSYWFNEWSGRYVAFSLAWFLEPLNHGLVNYYGINSVIFLTLFLVSLYLFLSRIIHQSNKENTGWLLVGLIFLYFNKLTSPFEFIYWLPSAISYTLGLILCLFLGWVQLGDQQKNRWSILIITSIIGFISTGSAEIIGLIILFNLGLPLFMDLVFNRDIPKWNKIIPLFLTILGILIVYFAPGNLVRASKLSDFGMSNLSIAESLVLAFKNIFTIVKDTFIISPFLLLIVFLFSDSIKINEKFNKHLNGIIKVLFWIAAHFLMIICFATVVIKQNGYLPGRVQNLVTIYLLIWTLISILILKERFIFFNRLQIRSNVIIPIAVIFYLIFQTISSQNRFSRAIYELTSGTASNYKKEANQLYDDCKMNQGKDLVISPFVNRPNSIFSNDLNTDPNHWENRHFSKCFNIKSIRVDSTLTKEFN